MAQLQPWQLKTPGEDGQVLLWPDPTSWAELAGQAAERFARGGGPALLGEPLAGLRLAARAGLPILAGPRPDPQRPWVVTGHQTFPYHPGVWAKNVAIDATAARVGAAAVNLNVDHDLPRAGPQLAWPALDASGRLVRRGALELDHQQPFERQPAPSAEQVEQLCHRISNELDLLLTAKRSCPFNLPHAESTFARDPKGGAFSDFGAWFASSRGELDRGLGLMIAESLSSRVAAGDAFLLFAADAVVRAGELHAAYNDAVRRGRALTGHEPAPELRIDGGAVELPLWSLRAEAAGRHRVFAAAAAGQVRLSDGCGVIGDVPAEALARADRAVAALRRVLGDAGAGLRPRALTLTLFARLLLADLFVHGVGGAGYDVATDLLFESFYRLAAPPYAVASATLLLPLDGATATAEEHRQARYLLRDLRFNPQRHLPHQELSREPAASLVAAKWAAVERNQALRGAPDRRATQDPQTRLGAFGGPRRAERAGLFARVRLLNRELLALLDDDLARRQAAVDQLAEQLRASQIALARDYFYGLFPAERLVMLRDRINGRLTGAK